MFASSNRRDEGLQATIDDLRSQMNALTADDPAYASMADQLVKLYEIKDPNSPKSVSPDTLLAVSANLLGIFLIIRHEQVNVIATKAFSFIRPLK